MEQTVFHLEMDVMTAGLEYTFGNTVFAAEYTDTAYDLSVPILSHAAGSTAVLRNLMTGGTMTTPGTGVLAKDFHAVGYYGSVSHRFTDWFEMGVYYSEYYPNKDDKDGKIAEAQGNALDAAFGSLGGFKVQAHTRWLKDTCLAFRFDLTPNWILKAETHYMDGAALMYSADGNMNAAATGTDYDDKWMLYAMKLSYSF
jgi:hypothetical protein